MWKHVVNKLLILKKLKDTSLMRQSVSVKEINLHLLQSLSCLLLYIFVVIYGLSFSRLNPAERYYRIEI